MRSMKQSQLQTEVTKVLETMWASLSEDTITTVQKLIIERSAEPDEQVRITL